MYKRENRLSKLLYDLFIHIFSRYIVLGLSLLITHCLSCSYFSRTLSFSHCVCMCICVCVCGCVYLCVSRVFLLVLSLEYLVISILKWENSKGKTLVVNNIENNSNIIANIGMYVRG